MKKKIALLISGMGLVSAGFGQYPFSGPTTTVNSDVNSSTTESQFNTSIVAPSPSTTTVTDHYSGTANVTYTGGQSIVLQPGFYASGFSSGLNGFFKAVIGGTQVAAQIMSGWPFYKYSRFEIGVQLPASVQAKIDTYLASISSGNPVISCSTSGLPTTYYNPYDPNQIEIDAVFTSPSSINYPRNGFYYQDVTANTTDGSYSVADDPWPFRIRFAPPQAGNWTVTITAKVNGATLSGSAFVGTFTVTDDANKGNIIVSGNQHYLSFQDDGSSYFPVGQDLNQADERFSKGIFCWGCGVPPDMYALHQQRVASLASNGGNFMRLFMSPQSYQFEFVGPTSAENVTPATHLYGSNDDCHLSPPPYNGVTNTNAYFTPPTTNLRMPGYYEQLQAYEMDNVFNISEANGVYMMLTILPDQYFDVGEAPSESWGTNNPYYNYLKSQYPSDSSNHTKLAEDFFTDACAQQFFKDHLYYMQARWGYSPNIATWELINETEQTCLFTDAAYPGGTSLYMDKTEYPNAQTEISNWVTTMRNYITNSYVFYPVHLFTSGYGSGPCVDGSNGVDVSDYNYDLFDSHSYTWGQDNPITEFSCRLSYYANMSWANSVYNNPSSSHTSTNRPFIFGEMGHGCAGLDGCTNDGLHGSLWSGAFMSSGAASYFWGQDNDALRANFNALHIFFSSINFSTTTFDYNTTQHVNSIATGVNVEQFYLNDNYYGTVRQMGWLRNTTVNWQGEDYNCAAGDGHCWWDSYNPCGSGNTDICNQLNDCPNYNVCACEFSTVSYSPSSYITPITFTGLSSGTAYTIEFYDTYSGHTMTQTATSNGSGNLTTSSNITFANALPSFTAGSFQNCPDYGYKIYPSAHPLRAIRPSDDNVSGSVGLLIRQSLTTGQYSIVLNNVDAAVLNQPASVNVFDMLGNNVYMGHMQVTEGSELNIDFSNKAKGVYLVVVQTANKVLHGKVVIQ